MSYSDPYLYPGTDVLINKFNCKDQNELKRLEALTTGGNILDLQKHPVKGKFDFDHLKRIHYSIFRDIYHWAGKVRTVDIGKNNLFCRVQFINDYAENIFSVFYPSCYSLRDRRNDFIVTLASHYADLNALHPFREGNGRSQREFTRELCLECGYAFDLTQTRHKQMLSASIRSFNTGDSSDFVTIFQDCVIPLDEYEDYQSRLTREMMILSQDDI